MADNKKQKKGEFRWHGMVSSGGTMELSLYFPDGIPEKKKEGGSSRRGACSII